MIVSTVFLQFLAMVIFFMTVCLHIAKKNVNVAVLYGIQSLAVTALLAASFLEQRSIPLLVIVLVTFGIKTILAPSFFVGLAKKHQVRFNVSSYLNTPVTLFAIALITTLVNSRKFAPLTGLVPGHQALLALAFSSMLVSIFLMVNRKGALSQIVSVLSLENSIVAFGVFAGLEQSAVLQLGIMFDILVWIVVSSVLVSMLYKHHGSLDVTSMRHLKD